jgi:large subunit ribosomal protein L25
MLELAVQKRDGKEKPDSLRKKGVIPAVFYGRKQESTPVSILSVDFMKVWKEAGESTVVTLKMDDGKAYDALIHDIDLDPITDKPRHADFYVFEEGHKVEVEVPIEFVGIAPAVKDHGGSLVKVLHELKITAMPKDLPHQIEIDTSVLAEIGSELRAKDIKLPNGVTLAQNPEEVVVLVAGPKEEEEEVPVEPADISSIEVEKKGKEANEGEEKEGSEGQSKTEGKE